MQVFLEYLSEIIFGLPLAVIIFLVGVYLTFKTKCFQVRGFVTVLKNTVFKKQKNKDGISAFAACCTALAATIGTGNIVGVSVAVAVGGAGAVFWMWVSAIFGCATAFFENYLAAQYRQNKNGENYGGAFLYLKHGISNKTIANILSIGFTAFCLLSSFTMGNMVQAASFSAAAKSFNISSLASGCLLFVICFITAVFGVKGISRVTSFLVPVMSVLYIAIAIIIFIKNYKAVPSAIITIFKEGLGFNSVAGGFCGAALKKAITTGFKRGVFSNEAGLGSTTIAAASSNEKPKLQGYWGIFQVFFDTIVICSLTALIVLTSGVDNIRGLDGVTVISNCFYKAFGDVGSGILSVMIILFSASTIIGWCYFGVSSAEFLFGKKIILPYKITYAFCCLLGCNIAVNSCFLLADVFNGFMAFFNIIGIILLLKGKKINDL